MCMYNCYRAAYQDITELMEGRAMLRPGNMKASRLIKYFNGVI